MALKKAIFLDKDGTLIKDVPYNVNPDLIVLSDDMITGLKALSHAGFLLIVISNQAGVALGHFEIDQLSAVEEKLNILLLAHGVKIDAYYYCPHHPEGIVEAYRQNCDCRKPAAGLLKQASNEMNISLAASWMIGDILNDVEAGNAAGCRTVLIDNGNETEWIGGPKRHPHFVAPTINAAASIILESYKNAILS